MRAVGLKVLKNRLSEYVRIVAAGEIVLVTDRDRVVAELGPPSSGRAETPGDAFLADAVRRGWLQPRLKTGDVAMPPRMPITSWNTLERDIDLDREDR
jgi:antitoxin (DNA-binding transcriptional repressor) of toxin-antitoxin stability system